MKLVTCSRKKMGLITLLLGLLVMGLGLTEWASSSRAVSLQEAATARPSYTAAACPFQTAEEWQRFLERYASNPKWVETCEDAPCDQEYVELVEENIQHVLEMCQPFIAAHPEIASCTANYRRFVPTWIKQHDEVSYGFNVDNRTYLTQQESPDKPPGMMRPPPAIIAALPNRVRVEEAARKSGLKYLTHDSLLEGIRTFVLNPDPQGRYDQWLLLNLQSGQSTVQSNTPLSVLTVQKKDAAGHPLPAVRLHFRDYLIQKAGKRYQLALNMQGNGKCYSCHANGVRQLIARRTPVLDAKPSRGEIGFTEDGKGPLPTDFAFARLMEFNRRLRSYGSPDWDGKLVPEDHGPALGQAQGCVDCHNGRSRGILTVSTSKSQLEKKTYYELSMPYDTALQRMLERNQMKNPVLEEDEQIALKKALEAHRALIFDYEADRLPSLEKWLLEVPCKS